MKDWREDKTLKEAALEMGYWAVEQINTWVRPIQMIHPLIDANYRTKSDTRISKCLAISSLKVIII
ncbi:MAG: hypothetical protein AMJ79_00985 [Phycisphaerae bacterium SM23_30]|nr:MAG: hypothetical protein AMJ79_00985 [Phycisphaerae bacterium SM23_30]